ncbi:hypothetical protein GCM10010306_067750 [Streptomyces umbrinus]|nr:hypothetical protein GCM10010306_067750 [Streptomyces umbrinus]
MLPETYAPGARRELVRAAREGTSAAIRLPPWARALHRAAPGPAEGLSRALSTSIPGLRLEIELK